MRTSRPASVDLRGSFTKILGEGDTTGHEPFVVREIYWSSSGRGVFRGMHVPLPPHAARKLVFVAHGRVRDFVLDLRVGSPTYGVLWDEVLDDTGGGLVIPHGCAHGFEVLSETAAMVYAQDAFHHAESDGGVHYASAGVRLAATDPVLSERDRSLPTLDEFVSPFSMP